MSKSITDEDFSSEVLSCPGYVLVDFWAPWCGPCRQLSPVVDEISEEMAGTLKIVKMDIDQNLNTPTQFNVRSIPTLSLFKDGKHMATKVGGSSKADLLKWINGQMD